MGLDFSHSEARWSYSGFHEFRKRLAKEIGIELDSMQGFGGDISWKNIIDPIATLLKHSDCDGNLSSKDCSLIAPRLRDLVTSWKDEDYDKEKVLMLAEGMEVCASNNSILEFC